MKKIIYNELVEKYKECIDNLNIIQELIVYYLDKKTNPVKIETINSLSDSNSRLGYNGGNKYNKYTLKDLKQIAIKNKIKITKMVVISNDELHKKLKDKDIIINKNIKLEDFKRILMENNIKITKRVNLTKQELIKKLEI
jgi:hypothetical protein